MRFFKILILFLALAFPILLSSKSFGQCSGGTDLGSSIFICIEGAATTNTVSAGNYYTLNTIKGLEYTITATGNGITARTVDGSFVQHAIGSTLVFTAPSSGQVRIYNCGTGIVTHTYKMTGGSNTQDNATAAGNNQWIMHYYKRSDHNNNATPTEASAFAHYLGQAAAAYSETFNYSFGGAGVCIDVYSAGAKRINLLSDYFVTRSRMNSTREKGIYLADIGGDDGVRLTVDGAIVFNRWVQQSYNNYQKQIFKLTGNSNLLLEQYDSYGGNQVSFQNLVKVPNTISSNQVICSGSSAALLVGNDALANAPISSASGFGVTYQWQLSIDGTNFTNISGANALSYTPTVTVAGTYFFRRILNVTRTNSGMTSSTLTDESNVVEVIVRPTPTVSLSGTTAVCLNASAPNILFTNPHTLPIVVKYKINGGADISINVPASSSVTVAAATNASGNFTYNVQEVAYQSTPTCTNTSIVATATITVNAKPSGNLSTNNNPLCEGAPINLVFTATSGTGSFELKINGSDYTGIVSGTPFLVNNNATTTATFNLTKITDANGCILELP